MISPLDTPHSTLLSRTCPSRTPCAIDHYPMTLNYKSLRRAGTCFLSLTIGSLSVLLLTSCNKSSAPPGNSSGLTKIRVGYIGLTCEAPIFTAVEKGFFKEEGLEVELVRCQWATYKDALALGRFDVTHHLVMYFLKPIEQGLDVKFTGGIHRGCLRVQAG